MNKDKRNNIQLLGTLNNSDESGIIANANQVYDANEDKSTQDVSKEHTERIKTLETKENSMQTTLENITKTGEASAASNVAYNHSDSKLDATNVQQAIDELEIKKFDKDNNENIEFAKNGTGVTVPKGKVVYINSSTGENPIFQLATNADYAIASRAWGVTMDSINNNAVGKIIHFGMIENIDTSAYTAGTELWLGVNGEFTNVRPTSPVFQTSIGMVIRQSATVGSIFVNIRYWQGVDDEPTAGSDNLVKSGGVAAKIAELDYLKSELQKAITFKEIPFISLDSTSSPTNDLRPNDSETSRFVGVICRPLRNAKYRYQYWPYGRSFIRYYKGNVNTDAECVYNDTNSMLNRTEFVTPDVDFDFAVINLEKSSVLSYPINSFYALSIETIDIPDGVVTTDKLEDGVVTTDKLEDGAVTTDKLEGLNLFEYCLNACNGFTPNLDDFTNLTDDEDSWTAGLLKNNGEVDTAIAEGRNYKVSKYVDYDAPYGEPYSVLYANMNPGSYSEHYVQVAFYKKNDHSFVKAFQCVGYKRLILIPRGYSIRVSSCQVENPSLYFSASISHLKTIESVISNVQPSVDNLTSVISNVQSSVDNLTSVISNVQSSVDNLTSVVSEGITSDSTVETETYTNEVNPSTDNVEILNNKMWLNNGTLVDGQGRFSTFRLVIPSHTTSVNLSNYNIGVSNGGFLTENETWIKGINNSTDNMSEVEIPAGAYYIDVTFYNTIITSVVIFNLKKNIYNLPNIRLDVSQIDGSAKNNQWYGKKICIIGTSVAYGVNAEAAYAKIASERLGFEIVPAGVPGQAIHAAIDEVHGGILAPLTFGSTCLSKAEYEAAKNAGASKITIPDTPLPTSGESWVPGSGSYNSFYRTWENVFSEENKDVDLWIYAVLPNNNNFDTTDWDNFNKSTWTYNDGKSFGEHRTTFLGALLYLMDKMYSLNPNARMVFAVDSSFALNGLSNIESVSRQWNIPIINLWGKINTSPKSLKVIKSLNGTDGHPSTFGQERMGDIFTNELLLIS